MIRYTLDAGLLLYSIRIDQHFEHTSTSK